MYVNAEDVTTPQEHWRLDSVIYDEGASLPAVAFGYWDDQPTVGLRWNVWNEQGKALGNPQSRGYATWFVLPNSVARATLATLQQKQSAGNKHVRAKALLRAIESFKAVREFPDAL